MTGRTAFAAVAAGLLISTASIALATSVVPKSFRQLCREADRIVVGTVAERESRWADYPGGAIETILRLRVEQTILGSAVESLPLRLRGGEVDGLREEIPGLPRLEPGDRVVVFLREGKFVSPIVGFSQGLFRLKEVEGRVVVRSAAGQPITAVAGGRVSFGSAPGQTSAPEMELTEFLDAIEAELRGGASR